MTCENREKAAANQCRFALWIFLFKLTTTRGNCLQSSCDVQSDLGLKRKARWGRADGPTKSTHEQIIRGATESLRDERPARRARAGQLQAVSIAVPAPALCVVAAGLHDEGPARRTRSGKLQGLSGAVHTHLIVVTVRCGQSTAENLEDGGPSFH